MPAASVSPFPAPASPPAPPSLRAADPQRAQRLAELQRLVDRMQGAGGRAERALPLGLAEVDALLPGGGLARDCVHELGAADAGSAGCRAAVASFAAALAGRLLAGAEAASPLAAPPLCVWIAATRELHPPGLAAFGLAPERLIVVEVRRPADLPWAAEEVLRCGRGIGAVVAELPALDLTAARRLQLAAEAGGTTGLLLHSPRQRGAASLPGGAVTRWRIAPGPTPGDGLPGLGPRCWQVALERARNGRSGTWQIAWQNGFASPAPSAVRSTAAIA